MVFPSLKQARELARQGNVIPICKPIFADTETPVSVWMKLFKGTEYNFLLESVTGEESVARYSFIAGNPFMVFKGIGEAWSLTGKKSKSGSSNPISALRALLQEYKPVHVEGLPRFCGGAVGFFSYDSIRLWERIPDKNPKEDPLDDLFFGFYKDIVAFDNREQRLLLISSIIAENGVDIENAYNEALSSIDSMEKALRTVAVNHEITVHPKGLPVSNVKRDEYESAVERSKEYIKAGDIFQVVLSQRFKVEVDADPFDLYRILRIVNPSPYMYYMSIGSAQVIGASPEMLVRVEDGIVETRPIAGTRKRGKNEEEDERLIAELKADPKEIAEHVMLVDLGRNDVGRISEFGTVHVDDMIHIEKYSHVMHLVSNVRGRLAKDKDAFDALFSCFPAGTLSGAPKIRAMEIIDDLENVKRGLYGGALGYIDFNGNMDMCIVIRTIVFSNRTAIIQSGAGIVADSVPSKEYQETVDKASALFKAIESAGEVTQNG